MVNFHWGLEDHFWRIYTTDSETSKVYQADLFQAYKLDDGWMNGLMWGLVAGAATLALFAIIFLVLKVTKTGPFKPKENDQYSTVLLVNESQY